MWVGVGGATDDEGGASDVDGSSFAATSRRFAVLSAVAEAVYEKDSVASSKWYRFILVR